MIRFVRLLPVFALMMCIGAACHSKPPVGVASAPEPSDTTDLVELRARVKDLIGNAECTSVNQCRLIAYGAKPCGGPKRYLVYSIAQTDSTALIAIVSKYNAREAEMNKLLGRKSDCNVVARPQLRVVNGRCALDT